MYFSLMHAACLDHLIILHLEILIIFDEYKLGSSSLCNFSSLLSLLSSAETFPSAPCSQTPSVYVILYIIIQYLFLRLIHLNFKRPTSSVTKEIKTQCFRKLAE
jgi:hypothetical protein